MLENTKLYPDEEFSDIKGLNQLSQEFNVLLYEESIAYISTQLGARIPCIIPFKHSEEEINVPLLAHNFKGKFPATGLNDLLENFLNYGIRQKQDLQAFSYAICESYKYFNDSVCSKESMMKFLNIFSEHVDDPIMFAPLTLVADIYGNADMIIKRLISLEQKSLLDMLFIGLLCRTDEQFLAFFSLKSNDLFRYLKQNSEFKISENYIVYMWFIDRLSKVNERLLKKASLLNKLFKYLVPLKDGTMTKTKREALQQMGFKAQDIAFLTYQFVKGKKVTKKFTEHIKNKVYQYIVESLAFSWDYHDTLKEIIDSKIEISKIQVDYYWQQIDAVEYLKRLHPKVRCDYRWLYHYLADAGMTNDFKNCHVLQFYITTETQDRLELLNKTEKQYCLKYTLGVLRTCYSESTAEFLCEYFDNDFFLQMLYEIYFDENEFDFLLEKGFVHVRLQELKKIHKDTVINWLKYKPSKIAARWLLELFVKSGCEELYTNYHKLFTNPYYEHNRYDKIPGTVIPLAYVSLTDKDFPSLLEKILEITLRYDLSTQRNLLRYALNDKCFRAMVPKTELSMVWEYANKLEIIDQEEQLDD